MGARFSLWRVSVLALVQLALPVQSGNVPDLHPKYARVAGQIETVWQRPTGDPRREPKGIFFIAHGCMHQATDIFTYEGPDGWKFEACKTSNFGRCLGLPEEVQMRQVARSRGYLVMAVSGGTGRQSCWELDEDAARVAAAVKYVRKEEGLPDSLPVLAMGASSGGAFMGPLAMPEDRGGLPGLQCIVPMIMGLHGAEIRNVPTLFVHMPKDKFGAIEVANDIERLKQKGIRAEQIQVRQKPVSVPLLSRCLDAAVAKDVLAALKKKDLLDAGGFLKDDSRRGLWVDAAHQAIAGRSSDPVMQDESCLFEVMNLAWAMHEFTSEYAEQMIDFCENKPRLGPGVPAGAPAGQVLGGGSGALRGARANPTLPAGTQQILVFDAGSSGTRVHVFNMLPPLPGSHVPRLDLSVRDRQTLKIKPGLSHFARANDLPGTEHSIQQLLDFANTLVPAAKRPQTPAMLKATAGLRAVSEHQADAVLAQVRRTLFASGYQFRDEWVDIIKGREEAGLAWVAANYLQGTFDGSGDTPSIGIIEMGGGSTQVSFEVPATAHLVSSDSFIFTTALGRQYHTYSHSYLGYGQDYAQSKLRSALPKLTISDPCYPKGYSRLSSESLLVSGAGNASSCSAAIEASLFQRASDAPGHYSGEQPLHGKFLATQNFFFVRRDLGLPMLSGKTDMESASQQACAKKVELPAKDPGQPNWCFGLAYQIVLLRALKIPNLSGVSVEITNSVKGGDADWALGAAVMHVLQAGAHPNLRGEEGGSQGGWGTSWVGIATSFVAASALLALARISVWPRLKRLGQGGRKRATSPEATKVGKVEGGPAE